MNNLSTGNISLFIQKLSKYGPKSYSRFHTEITLSGKVLFYKYFLEKMLFCCY